MSKLKHSLRRSFNAYTLLMHNQRTDPWVDSDQRVISQRRHKVNLVQGNRWGDFISGCSCYQGEKKPREIQEFCSFGLGHRKIGLNKTPGLFFISHWARNSLDKRKGKAWPGTWWAERSRVGSWLHHQLCLGLISYLILISLLLSFLICTNRDNWPHLGFGKI